MKHTLSILMQNESGALVRVAGLFAARGYNRSEIHVELQSPYDLVCRHHSEIKKYKLQLLRFYLLCL